MFEGVVYQIIDSLVLSSKQHEPLNNMPYQAENFILYPTGEVNPTQTPST